MLLYVAYESYVGLKVRLTKSRLWVLSVRFVMVPQGLPVEATLIKILPPTVLCKRIFYDLLPVVITGIAGPKSISFIG